MRLFLKKAVFYGLIVLMYFAVTGIFNYNFDPYGMLKKRKEFVGIRPNEHSLKVYHVLDQKNKYNSFLFSNSKGGALHFNQLNDECNRWYNMTYSLGTPEEFYDDIALFLENNVEIKNIVIALDEGAIYERASAHQNQASRKFVSMQEKSMNWEYLFLPISLKKFLRIDLEKKHVVHDIYDNGNYYEKNAYPSECDSSEELVMLPYPKEDDVTLLNISSQMETFRKIQKLCFKRGVGLSFLAHPVSYENYMKSTAKRIQFTQLLSALEQEKFVLFQPFRENLIQNNSCYWLDRHHYTKKVGDSILKLYRDFRELPGLK